MTGHFQGNHAAQGNAANEAGAAGIDLPGHAPRIASQIITRLGNDPAGKVKIGELLALPPKYPLVGTHARQQNQRQFAAHGLFAMANLGPHTTFLASELPTTLPSLFRSHAILP